METNTETTESTESTETVEPESTDDSGGSNGAEASSTDSPPQKTNRQSRKQARIDVEAAIAKQAAAERELGELKGRYSGLESQFNELRQQIERDKHQAQQSNATNEAKSKIASLRQQARNYLVQSAQSKDPAEAQRLLDKHDELSDQANDLRDEMRDSERWEKRKGEISGQMPNSAVMGEVMYFSAKYPWLDSNVKAQKMARAHFEDLVEGGRQASRATMEEAVTWAAKVLGIGGTNGHASPAQRARYGGVSSGEGAGGGGGNSGDIPMTRENEAMALAAYRHLEPAKAIAQWKRDMAARRKDLEGE